MRKDYLTWVLLGALALLLTVSWGLSERRERLALKQDLDVQYQKVYTEMLDNVENVEVNLGKSIVSGSMANNALIMADIWRQAYEAQARLNELPLSHPVLERTSKFLAQTGDYAYSLTKNMAAGKMPSSQQVDQLKALHTQAGELSKELHRIFASAEDGRFTWGELGSDIKRRLPGSAKENLSGSMESVDKKMQEYPTLIYDGPFSDHINKINPRGVTGKEISREEAQDIARQFVDIPSGEIRSVSFVTTVNGAIPVYRFRITPEDRNKYGITELDVSIKGGHVLMAANARDVASRKISEREALDKAAAFLKGKGLGTMENTFYSIQDNVLLAAFANVQRNVLVYPDQVKVQVALDNGHVVGYEALDYFMTHQKRDIPPAKISMEQARKKVNQRLTIDSSRLVIIPRDVGGEVLAYEFRGKIEGDVYYVYINAQTGAEESILKLIQTGGGTMAL